MTVLRMENTDPSLTALSPQPAAGLAGLCKVKTRGRSKDLTERGSGWLSGKESAHQCQRHRLGPWAGGGVHTAQSNSATAVSREDATTEAHAP